MKNLTSATGLARALVQTVLDTTNLTAMWFSSKKRPANDPNESGKLDVYRDLAERVLNDDAKAADTNGRPGQSIIEAALAARDVNLLRAIAAERKGLNDEQRQALLLVAEWLACVGDKCGGQA